MPLIHALKNLMGKAGLCIISALVLSGCWKRDSADPYEANPSPAEPTEADALAVEMFCHVVEQGQGNVVFSPASVEVVLHALCEGAAGQTRKELAALPYGKQGVASAMQVESATAVFADNALKLKPDSIPVRRAPFTAAPGKALKCVNAWCDKKTHGKIPSILSEMPSHTRLLALNAVCLKGKWLRPFEPTRTENHDFHLRDGSIVQVTMMREEPELLYAKGEDWQAVALFYRTDGRPGEPGCFIGILPRGDARAFAAKLTPQKFNAIRAALAKSGFETTEVYLPRFEVNCAAISLAPALRALGVKSAFSPQEANFAGMAEEPLYLSDVLQKCHVKVDEQGTEAAAATEGILCEFIAYPKERRVIRFDRPFLWVIGDLSTDAPPYFMGLVEKP